MSGLAELSPKEISVVSGRVLESIDDQEQYFLTYNEEGTENYDADLIISTKSTSVWDVSINFKPFIQISDVELLGQISDHFRAISEELERMVDQEKFQTLAEEWKKSQRSSLAGDMARNPNYLRIIGMGEAAIPCILAQLQNELEAGEPDHWFMALWSITGENPIQPKNRGLIREMAKDWIRWGEQAGVLRPGFETPGWAYSGGQW